MAEVCKLRVRSKPYFPVPLLGRGHPEEAIYSLNLGLQMVWYPLSQPSLAPLSMGSSSALHTQVMSGRGIHLRDLSGYFRGHCQPLGGHIGAHARCPLRLFLTVGLDSQLFQPFFVVFGSEVSLQIGRIDEVPRASQTAMQAASWQVRVGLGVRVGPGPGVTLRPQLPVNLIQVWPPPLGFHLAG